MKLARWFIGIVGGTLVGLWIAVALVSRAPVLQRKLVEALNDKMDADVELESFDVDTFPRCGFTATTSSSASKARRTPPPSSRSATSRCRAASSGSSGASGDSNPWNCPASASPSRRERPNDKEAGEEDDRHGDGAGAHRQGDGERRAS